MNLRRFHVLALAGGLALSGASAAHAQGFGNMLQGAEKGALQGAMNQTGLTSGTSATQTLLGAAGLPSLSSASTGNITGLLSYCVQNNVVSGQTATNALSTLTAQTDRKSDATYTAGQQGLLQVGNGNQLSLASLKEGLRQKVCQSILNRAQSLL